VNPKVMAQCKPMLTHFCKGVASGNHRGLHCLMEHVHDSEMDAGCRKALVSEQDTWNRMSSIHPWLAVPCSQELVRLDLLGKCTDKDIKGWKLTCLWGHKGELNQTCATAVTKHQKRVSADLRARAGMVEACTADLHALCANINPGAGRSNRCLQRQVEQIKNSTCKVMVQQVHQTDRQHASINYQTQKACINEVKTFCSEVKPGTSRVLACLGRSEKEEGFSQACRDVLRGTDVNEAVMKHPGHSSWEQLDNWVMTHGNTLDRLGLLQMGGLIAVVSLLGFGISYCLVRRKFMGVYNVVVPRDLES